MSEPNIEVEKGKNIRGKKIFIGLFASVVLIVVAVIACIAALTTPKKVFHTSLDKIFYTKNEKDVKDIKTIIGNLSIRANIESKKSNEINDIINNLDLKLNYGMDYENNKMNFEINSLYKDKDLIAVNIYAKEDNAYVYLDKIFDKYIQVPIENYTKIYNSRSFMEDYQIIIEEIEKALKLSLKDKYFIKEKATLVINNKEIKATKNTLNLTTENQKTLAKEIMTTLNNDNFIESLANLIKKDKRSIKKTLEKAIKEDFETDEELTISIYTKGVAIKKAIGFEIKDATDTLTVTKENDNTFKYTVTGEEKFDGTFKITKEEDKYKEEILINNNEDKVTIYLDTSNKYNEKLEEIDTTNSVFYEDLTEENQNSIMINLLSNEGIVELTNALNNLTETQDDYSTSYDLTE